ncbi:hypothetical protein OH77DRAFT_1518071 [Trametes cingulata]|nr:hypothetical protein OH77DRAFT_1518071 [Trametes cingulata]
MVHTATIKAREIRTKAELYVLQLLKKVNEWAASHRALTAQAIKPVPGITSMQQASQRHQLSPMAAHLQTSRTVAMDSENEENTGQGNVAMR